ncbi:ABC transporter ATP-binding protein [Salmonella enterica subsp. enterica serovar Enteritidis]|nr:ABC transporter ATP-binding protein [Salmonella enterica subsp. enterica serovar Enteritidis]
MRVAKLNYKAGEVFALVKRILRENAGEYRGTYIFAIICLLIIAVSTAFTAWIMRDVIDQIFVNQRQDLIFIIAFVLAASFIIRGIASYYQAVALAKIGNNLVARYQRRIFDHLMKLGMNFYADNRSGALAAQINQNVYGIRDLISTTLTTFARDIVTLVGLIVVMVIQDPVLSIAALFIGPPLVWSVNYVRRRVRQISLQSIQVNSRLMGAMQEATQGVAVVKAYTMEDQLSRKIDKLVVEAEGRSNKIAAVTERLAPVTEILAGLAVAGIIIYAGYKAAVEAYPPGAIFSFITAFFLAYDPVRRLSRLQVNLERAMVNARMIYDILDIEPRQADSPDAAALTVSRGEVRFDAVNFSYAAGHPVLTDVSFVAEAGKTTAIVGASGAGKSTIISLLERFYDVDSGVIAIDSQNIAAVTKHSLRSAMAYVSQQPYLFEGTIRDNIRYARPDATDAEIEAAARLAAADEFIRQQPQGYDTPVGENGASLSGGQRQRLAIARAIVRDAPILVFDEATSALDNESEARVQQAIEHALKGRTAIVIAHRLSTIINADKIIVMEAGRIIEQGSHAELLVITNGAYQRLYRFQGGIAVDIAPAAEASSGSRT